MIPARLSPFKHRQGNGSPEFNVEIQATQITAKFHRYLGCSSLDRGRQIL